VGYVKTRGVGSREGNAYVHERASRYSTCKNCKREFIKINPKEKNIYKKRKGEGRKEEKMREGEIPLWITPRGPVSSRLPTNMSWLPAGHSVCPAFLFFLIGEGGKKKGKKTMM
jgi:hypothetical protein